MLEVPPSVSSLPLVLEPSLSPSQSRSDRVCVSVSLTASPGAAEGGAGERGAAGIRQRHPAANRRSLPRHPGAGRQRPGGVLLTSATSPSLQNTRGQAQEPTEPRQWRAVGKTGRGVETHGAPFTKKTKAKKTPLKTICSLVCD